MIRSALIFLLLTVCSLLRAGADVSREAATFLPGLERMELHITQPAAGRDFGTHGYMLGGGSTRIYTSLQGMIGEADNGGADVEDPSVSFLNDTGGRLTGFYLIADPAMGAIHIEANLAGASLGTFEHTLTPDADFSQLITTLVDIVAGEGMGFDPSVSTLGNGAGLSNPAFWATPALIPVLAVAHQIENQTIFYQGLVSGVIGGLRDDWEFLKLIGSGAVFAGNWSVQHATAELQRWRTDPKARLAEIKEMLENAIDDHICKPLADVADEASTLEGFKNLVWRTVPYLYPPAAAYQALNSATGTDLRQKTAEAFVAWIDDFNGRMLAGAERAAWLEVPLATDRLFSQQNAIVRECAFTFGHVYGYLAEQVTVGAITGAVIGKVLVKGGINLVGKLATRTGAMVASRLSVLKKWAASLAISAELRQAVEDSLALAARLPGPEAKPIIDTIETGLRALPAQAPLTWKVLLEESLTHPRLASLFQAGGPNARFLQATAEVVHHLGGEATEKAIRNLPKLCNALCPLGESGLADDLFRFADLVQSLKPATPQGKTVLKELLESIDGKTAQQLIDEGVPMPASIKDLYPTMYHHTSSDILIDFTEDLGSGVWKLGSYDRFITPTKIGSAGTAQDLLQLPLKQQADGTWVPLAEKGRFRVEIDSSDISSSIKVPQADLHSGQSGVRPWAQPILKDNPVCGNGGVPQFVSGEGFSARIFDTKTSQYVEDKVHLIFLLSL